MKCLLRVPAVVVALMVTSTVSASPFHYDELVSGDLDYAGTFVLGVGVNTVSGVTGSIPGDRFGDSDVFTFKVPAGTMMTAILFSFSTSGTATALTTAVTIIQQIPPEDASVGSLLVDLLGSSPIELPPRVGQFPAGLYLFDLATPLHKFPRESDATTFYQLDLTVDAVSVPEPTSSLLLAVGFAVQCALRVRRSGRHNHRVPNRFTGDESVIASVGHSTLPATYGCAVSRAQRTNSGM